ncbi:MAG: chorismate mutase [Candidatus Bipolaricaulota bacterium]
MIEDLREEIDKIDEELVRLMNRRAKVALEIGKEKKSRELELTDPGREEAVLAHVRRSNSGPFSNSQLERVYRALISETKEIQTEVGLDDSRNEAGSN